MIDNGAAKKAATIKKRCKKRLASLPNSAFIQAHKQTNREEHAMKTNNVEQRIKSTLFRFNTLSVAKSYADRCIKPLRIVLGDHDGERGEYWVVTPADASRLERAGYEIAA